MTEPWTQFQLNQVCSRDDISFESFQVPAPSNQTVKIDFEILPDPQDPRSPSDIIQQIEDALKNTNSLLRTGPSGFLLDGAQLQRSPVPSPTVAPPMEPLQPVPQVFPDPTAVPAMEPLPIAPAETPRDTTGELFTRITELLKTIDDMKAEKDRADLEKADLLKKLSDADSVIIEKLKEIDSLTASLTQTQKDLSYITAQFEDSKKQLAQAKEMWMKESARATKLRDQLDKAELDLADKEKEISKRDENFKKTETENTNLKHLINRSNDIVSTAVLAPHNLESKFAPTDSYFVRPSTMAAQLHPPPLTTASQSRAPPTSVNMLFTNPHLAGAQMTSHSLSAASLSGSGRPSAGATKYLQLSLSNDGVLYEDEIVQIGIKAKYTGLGEGVLGVYYGNKTSGTLQNVQTKYSLESANGSLHLTTSPIPTQLGPKSQVCQRVSAQLSAAFAESPKLVVSFLLPDNTPRTVPLRLPISINKFMQPREISVEEFFANWRMQLFLLNEASAVVNVVLNLAQIARVSTLGGALALHHQVDQVADNLVLVGQFPSDSIDGIRCATIPEALVLVRIEVGAGANSGKARIAARSNDPVVAEAVRNCLVEHISAGTNA